MISFFSVMIYVTSIIAIVVTLVFYAGILMSNKKYIQRTGVYFLQCTVENLQSFKRGVCFGLLVLCIWLIQKGMP